MGEMVALSDIQLAIERCMSASPPVGLECRLSKDANLLAEIFGEMIYRKLNEIHIRVLSGEHLEVYRRWHVTTGPAKEKE